MRGLTPFAIRSLLHRRVRTALTIAGVALGVGVLYASLATSAGIDGSIDRTVRDLVGRADLRVAALGEAGLGQATVAAIAGTPGVAIVSPEIQVRTFLQRDPAVPATVPEAAGYRDPVAVLGVDPAAYPSVHAPAIAAGSMLKAGGPAGIVMTERLASETGLGVGSSVTLLGSAASGPVTYPIVGIVAGDGPVPGALGRSILMPLPTVSTIFDVTAATRVDLVAAPAASPAAIADELKTRITGQPYVLSTPADIAASLTASTADFRGLTALIAAIALFIGAFLIFNTLSMTVGERVRDVGLLRAAGTTRRQVNAIVLVQAATIGVVGSVVGLAVGFILDVAIALLVRSIGDVRLDTVVVPPAGLALAVVVGIAVTLVAALEPARRAGLIPPVEALRARVDPAVLRPHVRWLAAILVVVAVAGFIVWPGGIGRVGVLRPILVYAILIAGTFLVPLLLVPLGRVAGSPFRIVLPLEERLGRSSLLRDRGRATLTVGALMVGVATVVALVATAADIRAAASAYLTDVLPGDMIVSSIRPAAASEGLADQLGLVRGVARVSPVASFDVALDGVRTDAAAIVGRDFLVDGRLTFVGGDRTAALQAIDSGGAVILPRSVAERLHATVNDRLALLGSAPTPVQLTVAGIVDRSVPGRTGDAVLVGWPDAPALGVAGADYFVVRFAPGARAAAQPALEQAARELALEPRSLEEIEGSVGGALGRVFDLFDALALVAVIVAGLGIVNTLTMSVAERIREIGILRAVGMTRRQVGRMVLVEAGILGMVGAVVGVAVGLVAGVAMTFASVGASAVGLAIPWLQIVLVGVFGLAVAMLAAWQPARIAASVSIVDAVKFD